MQTREGAMKTRTKLLSRNPNYYSDIAKLPRVTKIKEEDKVLICQSPNNNKTLATHFKVSERTIARHRKNCK